MKRILLILCGMIITILSLTSCSNQQDIDSLVEKKVQEYIEEHQEELKGNKGDTGSQGIQGVAGLNGNDGEDGKDGLTPYIGTNGNWWIGDEDTGIAAKSEIIVKTYANDVELNVNNFSTYINIHQVESGLANAGKILLVKPYFSGSLSYAYYDNVEISYQLDGKIYSVLNTKDVTYTGTTVLDAGGYSLLPYEIYSNFTITIIDIKGNVLY